MKRAATELFTKANESQSSSVFTFDAIMQFNKEKKNNQHKSVPIVSSILRSIAITAAAAVTAGDAF